MIQTAKRACSSKGASSKMLTWNGNWRVGGDFLLGVSWDATVVVVSEASALSVKSKVSRTEASTVSVGMPIFCRAAFA
jgi:hypothetical protein